MKANFRSKEYREGEQKRFLALLEAHHIPRPELEYQFDPERRWRFDYAWPSLTLEVDWDGKSEARMRPSIFPVALEQEGGLFVYGGHSRGAAQIANMEKYNTATLLGWRVFRFPPADFKSGAVIPWLRSALRLDTNDDTVSNTTGRKGK